VQKLSKPLKSITFGGPNRCLLVHWDEENTTPLEVPMGYDEWESMRRMTGLARDAAVIGVLMRYPTTQKFVVEAEEAKPAPPAPKLDAKK
jgi:hypothetical protein